MLPAPRTMPISTPRSWTVLICSATALRRSGSVPYSSEPIRDSPDSFSRIRLKTGPSPPTEAESLPGSDRLQPRGELGTRANAELDERVVQVRLDRGHAEIQRGGDLGIAVAQCRNADHLALTGGQMCAVEPRLRRRRGRAHRCVQRAGIRGFDQRMQPPRRRDLLTGQVRGADAAKQTDAGDLAAVMAQIHRAGQLDSRRR